VPHNTCPKPVDKPLLLVDTVYRLRGIRQVNQKLAGYELGLVLALSKWGTATYGFKNFIEHCSRHISSHRVSLLFGSNLSAEHDAPLASVVTVLLELT
jgi:hypothetical protein